MASFNKLTIGNQTFDVSGVIQKLDAQWIQEGNKWYVGIPPKSYTDYQVGQVYQINFREMYNILVEASVEGRPKYNQHGIETYVVSRVDDVNNEIIFQRLHTTDDIELQFNGYVNDGVVVFFRCDEEYFLPYTSNTYVGTATSIEIDQEPYYSISTDILYIYMENPNGIIFYLGSTAVKGFADGEDLYFINLATYNQIPYERDDNENRCLIKVSDIQASCSLSSSSSGTQLLRATTVQNDMI